jgi:nucleotide-binding universal stress UspA family protein
MVWRMSFAHVLVLYDGSAEAGVALSAAAALASRDRALLTVAAVVELEGGAIGCSIGASTWNEVLRDAAHADLRRAAALLDMPACFEVLCGRREEAALVDGADLFGCDAIMLPSRPRRLLSRAMTRNRAPAIRRRAHCAVLQPD